MFFIMSSEENNSSCPSIKFAKQYNSFNSWMLFLKAPYLAFSMRARACGEHNLNSPLVLKATSPSSKSFSCLGLSSNYIFIEAMSPSKDQNLIVVSLEEETNTKGL